MSKKDVIIVLGGLEKDMSLRLEKAVELFKEGWAPRIIMSGLHAQKMDSPMQTEAHFMESLAIKQGVPKSAIILEEKSLNTIENAYFSKKILKEYNWINIVVVTSDYHKNRAEYVFHKVLGDNFILELITVKNILLPDEHEKQIKKEKEFMDIYQQWFANIADGNEEEIISALHKNHPDYKI